jgi:hypothetical protein
MGLADLVFGLQAVAKKHRQQQLKYSIQVCSEYEFGKGGARCRGGSLCLGGGRWQGSTSN